MALKKPSDFFREDNKSDDTIHELVKRPELQSFSEAFDAYKNNLSKLDNLADTINCVEDIKSEIQDFIKKEDLDNSMMAYTFLLEESINKLKDDVKSINKKDLLQIQGDVSGLTEQINEFVEIEVPKYKSVVVESELRSSNHIKEFKEKISNIIEGIEDSVEDFKKESVSQLKEETLSTLDEKINLVVESKNKDLEEEIETLKTESITEYREFIVDNKLKSENNLNKFKETLDETISKIEIEIDGVRDNKDILFENLQKKIKEVKNLKDNIIEDLEISENYKIDVNKKVSGLEAEIIRNESHLKQNNNYIEKIQGEVRSTLKRLNLDELERQNSKLTDKIKYLEEVFEKFSEKELLSEGILNITPETNNSDTLTPLNKNFVTLDQLQEHYRVFINRIQQQLSTLGGGGETQLQYLDDIVGIATNLSDYNGKFLKVDTSQPAGKNFVFASTGGGGYELPTASAGTLGGIKIGSGLSIDGGGVVTASGGGGGSTGVGGTWAIEDVGISTTKNVGIGTTAKDGYSLYVQGDARITGILTVGEASITLDPSAKKLTGLDEIQIGSGTAAITIKKSESTGNIEFADKDGKEAPVGIGTTVNINTTGIITATSFSGDGSDLTGITGGLWAQTDAGINTSSYVGIGTTNPLADLQVGTGVTIYGNSGIVSATTFKGNATSATTATLSLFSFMTNNNTTNETVYPVFVDGTTSSEALETDSGFMYNPSSGILTATGFSGNLYGTLQTGNQPQITTVGTLSSLSVTGDVSIGGTLTYEDVTNIDSVGLVTARLGIHVLAGAGVSIAAGGLNVTSGISTVGFLTATDVWVSGAVTATSLDISGNVDVDGTLEADTITVNGTALDTHIAGVTVTNATNAAGLTNSPDIDVSNIVGTALSISGGISTVGFLTATDVWVSGAVTATSFKGSGANLTGLTGATAATYGDASNVAAITVNSDGKITGISNVSISGGGGGGGGSSLWESNATGINTSTNVGIGTTTASDATLTVDVGTATTAVVVQGSEGQLFSVTNSLSSGSIFSVNDISGIPSIDVDADGTIQLAPYGSTENVGVGTTNPTSKLHVVGGAKITGVLTTGQIADSNSSVGTAASVLSSTGSGLSWVANSGGDVVDDTSPELGGYLDLNSKGIYGVGVITATDFNSTSDIKLKSNIQPIDDPLAKVIQIEGVSFNWKENNIPALGVIADQVQEIIPELVRGDDPKTVNYNGLIGLLIEAVKEQQTQIDSLKERISKLE